MSSPYNTKEYQQFVQKRQDRFITPDTIIASFVKKATNSYIHSKKRIIKGENNEVYDVTLQNNKEFIVRINHTDMMSFKREKWALEKCQNIGIPTPHILLLEEITLETHQIHMCIETKIIGDNYSDNEFSKLPKPTQKTLLFQAGKILSLMHTIPAKGFGELDASGTGEYSDFYQYLMEREKDKWFILQLAAKHRINPETIEKTYEVMKQYAHLFKNAVSFLTHGDFRPDHIFYKDNEVSGIIDFEIARGADPVDEFARWDYYYSETIPLMWLQDGYTNKEIFDKNFDIKLHVLKLLWAIILLYYNDSVENTSGIEVSKRNFHSSLKFLTV